jgi:hypothetical protein
VSKKLKQELGEVFDAPTPTKKSEFLSSLPFPKTSNYEIFFTQIWYIRKRFWCLSILIGISLVWFNQAYESVSKTIGILSALLPFLVVLSTAEISRSTSCNMAEMEMSCRFSLSKVTLARLSLIGSFHFIVLFLMVLIVAKNIEYNFLQFALYSITPFLLCSYLSFFIVNHVHTKDATYICGGVAGIVSFSIFLLSINVEIIYAQKFVLLWCITLVITIILLIKEIINLMKRTEELQWNLPSMA